MELTETILDQLRRRKAAGESVKALAAEVGLVWQKLDKAIRNGLSGRAAASQNAKLIGGPAPSQNAKLPELAARDGDLTFTEKYRPDRLAAVFGQIRAVRFLQNWLKLPSSIALLFDGDTGTGKTSTALALAAELGCGVEEAELGGVHVVASGEQNADAVREVCGRLWQRPMFGSGWKVLIVNEVDRMNSAVETIWLDRLENLPPRTVVIFTTNNLNKLSQRFRDRCMRVGFLSNAKQLRVSVEAMLNKIHQAETGKPADAALITGIVRDATEAGSLSFRRAVQLLQAHLIERK